MVNKKLAEELKRLDGTKNFLVVSNAENLQKNVIDIVEFMIKERKIPGLYVSLNKPYTTIREILKKRKIEDNLSFIDTLGSSKNKLKKKKNVLLLSNPADLTTIAISIGAFSKQVKAKKFLIIDALSTLLIYNNLESVAKFIQSLSSLASTNEDILMIFATSECKNDNLIQKITPFFDKVIKIS